MLHPSLFEWLKMGRNAILGDSVDERGGVEVKTLVELSLGAHAEATSRANASCQVRNAGAKRENGIEFVSTVVFRAELCLMGLQNLQNVGTCGIWSNEVFLDCWMYDICKWCMLFFCFTPTFLFLQFYHWSTQSKDIPKHSFFRYIFARLPSNPIAGTAVIGIKLNFIVKILNLDYMMNEGLPPKLFVLNFVCSCWSKMSRAPRVVGGRRRFC